MPGDYYLPLSAHRPYFQGDVFEDVPFVKAKSAGDPGMDPNVVVERRTVVVLGYPCDIYDQGKLVKVQTVAVVTSATQAGIPENWDGAFTYAPLPDLHGDGVMWAVNLRTAANIDVSYLRVDGRLRSLSNLGWAVLRQRIGLCATRASMSLESLARVGQVTWEEIALWQRWNEAGKVPEKFQQWLEEADPQLGGFTRRALLERGQSEQVQGRLEALLTS